MMYLIKPTKKKYLDGNLKILMVLFSLLVLFFLFNFVAPARFLVIESFSPFLKLGNYFYGFFTSVNKNQEADSSVANQIQTMNFQLIKNENERLRAEMKLKPNQNFLAAPILARPPQIPLDSLFLDKGESDGIKNEDRVFAGERILIGKIKKVSKNSSTVGLNSFAGTISYGFVDRTNEPLEIKGVGGGNMEAKVPIDFDIIAGDKILVDGSFNYLIAIVGAVEEDRSSGFKKILASLPVNISKIGMVFIEPFSNQ